MHCSEAKLAANRRNALRSSGPKTVEGKQRSRANGLKHGLTGEGVVLAEGDRSEVGRREQALRAELAPKSTLGAILVGQMATLSVRMERSSRREEASLATRVRHSGEAFDREQVDRARALFETIKDDPRDVVAGLRESSEGVDRLVVAWGDLRADLTSPARALWSFAHQTRAAQLVGLRVDEPRAFFLEGISRAAWGNFSGLGPDQGAELGPEARRDWARARLVEWVDAEVEVLEEHRATLDLETVALDRVDAADLALFDPSREATLARRYESEARRGFFKALNEFRQAEVEAPDESTEEAGPVEVPEPLGSSRERPSPKPREPEPVPGAGPRGVVIAREGLGALNLEGGSRLRPCS